MFRRIVPHIFCLSLLLGAALADPLGSAALVDIAARYGCSPPEEQGMTVVLRSPGSTACFQPNTRQMIFNGVLVWLNHPLELRDGMPTLSGADARDTLGALLSTASLPFSTDGGTVVLDPGHGGEDPGAIGPTESPEKDLVLSIAERVQARFRNSGIEVRLTRNCDKTLSKSERVGYALQCGADVFVSIHLNSAHNRRASGFETYVLPSPGSPPTSQEEGPGDGRTYAGNRHDGMNALLAYCLQRGLLTEAGGEDRGVKRARFDVLVAAPCPAALVECGFLSNRRDGRKLEHEEHLETLAEALARGLLTYMCRAPRMP